MSAPGLAFLSPAEGEIRLAEPLSRHTTLRIGGPAEIFVVAKTMDGLAKTVLAARAERKPFRILGKGSNVLVSDDGVSGYVAILEGEFLEVAIEGDLVIAGGGGSLGGTCAKAARAGLSGIESISGIPSSIGGAVRINAGAYGGEIFDVLESVTVLTHEGKLVERAASEIEHGYRRTALIDSGEIVCRARLRLRRAPIEVIASKTNEVAEKRRGALPSQPNAGSVFKNPSGQFAGKLLESCGLKGARRGEAEVSARHANVIVNHGSARASDVLELMRLMRRSVLEKFGIELVPEVELLGLPWP
jgi:UDP-N-acetylmuramate dehydrogenase